MQPGPAETPHATPEATAQASSWFARLHGPTVSVADLRAFQRWRETDEHDRAYRNVERLWAQGAQLKGDPEIIAALEAASEAGPGRPSRRTAQLAAIAAVLAVGLPGMWAYADGWFGVQTYQTAVGQQLFRTLADGSALHLDTDSRVAVRLGIFRRHLALQRGRSFFAVAHDPKRPFVVSAGETRVRAVGTRFSVERLKGQVRVVLVQGVVTVSSTTAPPGPRAAQVLKAGQQVVADGGIGVPAPVDTALATSWLEGQLVFRDLPLRQAVAQMDRYTTLKLELDDADAAETPVSGIFHAGDLESFATAAAEVCNLDVVRRADGGITLRKKALSPTS